MGKTNRSTASPSKASSGDAKPSGSTQIEISSLQSQSTLNSITSKQCAKATRALWENSSVSQVLTAWQPSPTSRRTISGSRADTLAIVGGTLIDGTGAAPVPDSAILIEKGRIVAAGPRSTVKIPHGFTKIDARGKTILPGLWDMHAHFEQVEWGPIYLAAGATTVRDVGNEFEFITAVRDAIANGRGLGPRMLLAGVVDGSGPLALGVERVDTPEEAKMWVDRYHDAGFQQMKIYSSVKLEELKDVTAEAHRLGMTVTGHIPEGLNAYQGVDAGMDQINHVDYVGRDHAAAASRKCHKARPLESGRYDSTSILLKRKRRLRFSLTTAP